MVVVVKNDNDCVKKFKIIKNVILLVKNNESVKKRVV